MITHVGSTRMLYLIAMCPGPPTVINSPTEGAVEKNNIF